MRRGNNKIVEKGIKKMRREIKLKKKWWRENNRNVAVAVVEGKQ